MLPGIHRCTLIDPRPQKISKTQRRWLKSFAASQHLPTDATQQAERSGVNGTSEVLPSSLKGQSPTQYATNGLQASRPAAPDFFGERSLASQLATEPSSRAARFDSAPAQAPAAEAELLPPAEASAFHDSAQAQESAAEASVFLPAQASAAELEIPGEEGQGSTACCQQPTPQGDDCQLHQSDSEPSAQRRRPDLRGTLSHQIQVSHKLLLPRCTASQLPKLAGIAACHSIVLTGINSTTQSHHLHLLLQHLSLSTELASLCHFIRGAQTVPCHSTVSLKLM